MKRLAILLLVVVLALSCKKEEPQLLSDFIVDNVWVTVLTDIDPVVDLTYIGEFHTNNTYTLSVTDGTTTLSLSGDYTINNIENQLNIQAPDLGNTGTVEYALFQVEWTEGVREMTWYNLDDPDNVLIWTEY